MILNNTRLDSLKSLISDSVDAAIIFDCANKRYLTGVNTDDAGTLVVTKNNSYFIIDSRYIEVAERQIKNGISIVSYDFLKNLLEIEEVSKHDSN